MGRARHLQLVDKSIDACLAAIEVYNKPDFSYREEAFSILMLNAWELLLKARVLAENGGNMRSIEAWEYRKNKDGSRSKRMHPRKNRSGNNMVIGVDKAAATVAGYRRKGIDADCMANIQLLKEVRDNAVHLRNADPAMSKRVQELGSAALKNFMHAAQDWFNFDLSEYNFYLMPIAFYAPAEIVESLGSPRTVAATNLLRCISDAESTQSSQDYNVTMNVELSFVRSKGPHAIDVKLSKDRNAVPVTLTESQIRDIWPWEYADLVRQLRGRYSDFRQDTRFHDIKRQLEKEGRLCQVRYLDPKKRTGIRKKFYSQSILVEFDKHYTQKG